MDSFFRRGIGLNEGTACELFPVQGAEVGSMNTGAVIGDKLNSQIFQGSHSAGWKIKIRQLLSLRCSRNFFSFNIYTNTCAYSL